MRIENLISKEHMKRKVAIAVVVAVAIAVTAGTALLYGSLNEAKTQREVMAKISSEYRERAPETARIEIGNVPGHFINALLIAQDSRFYEHRGMSVISVIRAAGKNLGSFLSGGPLNKQGGSTITQQLARQFIDNPQRTLKRKFEEIKIARVIESNFAKDEILEMYLNMAFWGNGAYGLMAASDRYFGHDYTQLTLSESAMLIPFLDAPSRYNFLADPVTAGNRQKRLLERIAAAE
jgi:penicillin-binding protein 1A